MLRDDERREIEAELAAAIRPQAALLDALKVVQRHRGHVPDEAVADLAELLGLHPAEVDDTATFYNLLFRRPVGAHVILVCDSVSCWLCGQAALLDRLVEHLGVEPGGTTADGLFTLLPMSCLGACEQAPAMMVDGELHGRVEPEAVAELLARYRAEGRKS